MIIIVNFVHKGVLLILGSERNLKHCGGFLQHDTQNQTNHTEGNIQINILKCWLHADYDALMSHGHGLVRTGARVSVGGSECVAVADGVDGVSVSGWLPLAPYWPRPSSGEPRWDTHTDTHRVNQSRDQWFPPKTRTDQHQKTHTWSR